MGRPLVFQTPCLEEKWIDETRSTDHLTLQTYSTSNKLDDMVFHQWPLLLTWFNFNPGMDK